MVRVGQDGQCCLIRQLRGFPQASRQRAVRSRTALQEQEPGKPGEEKERITHLGSPSLIPSVSEFWRVTFSLGWRWSVEGKGRGADQGWNSTIARSGRPSDKARHMTPCWMKHCPNTPLAYAAAKLLGTGGAMCLNNAAFVGDAGVVVLPASTGRGSLLGIAWHGDGGRRNTPHEGAAGSADIN